MAAGVMPPSSAPYTESRVSAKLSASDRAELCRRVDLLDLLLAEDFFG
ncbi:MAG: hypothetical protein V1774_04395 [Candidatus Eisenbacteria bacterium]